MTLYMIGIGLNDERDISVKGLELVRKADVIYLENYTSTLNVSKETLEEFYGKEIVLADREMVENDVSKILEEAKTKNVAFLVVGDVFAATTHVGILLDCKKEGVGVEIVHNASVFNAVSDIGLFLYQFGKITSIPFENSDVKAPVNVFNDNYEKGYHTLFLLDLDPGKNKFMSVSEAAKYLIDNGVDSELLTVGCSRMGGSDSKVKVCKLKEFLDVEFNKSPQCLIIPGKLHFVEEEAIERFINS